MEEYKKIVSERMIKINKTNYDSKVECDTCGSDKGTRSEKTDFGYTRFTCKECDIKKAKVV